MLPRLERDGAFLRALLKVQASTDALGAAIRELDRGAVIAAADDAFSFLLAAIAVFRRLETAERDGVRIGIAWYALRTNHGAITDLFERAKAQLADPDLHRALEQLRISLALAIQGLGEQSSPPGG